MRGFIGPAAGLKSWPADGAFLLVPGAAAMLIDTHLSDAAWLLFLVIPSAVIVAWLSAILFSVIRSLPRG